MLIGDLRRRITLESPTRTADGMSGFTVTWATVATVWARAWTVSSAEGTDAEQQVITRTQKFKIRYRSILPEYRISYGGRYFEIKGIDPDEKNEFIFLTCKEAV